MALTIADLIGANGIINDQDGSVKIYINDLVDSEGNKFLNSFPYQGVDGAERFLAAYFAYLNYRCRQQPATVEVDTGQVDVDTINAIQQPDNNQAFVSQGNPINDGFNFESRNGETQIRFDFNFSIYLNNTFTYEAENVV